MSAGAALRLRLRLRNPACENKVVGKGEEKGLLGSRLSLSFPSPLPDYSGDCCSDTLLGPPPKKRHSPNGKRITNIVIASIVKIKVSNS